MQKPLNLSDPKWELLRNTSLIINLGRWIVKGYDKTRTCVWLWITTFSAEWLSPVGTSERDDFCSEHCPSHSHHFKHWFPENNAEVSLMSGSAWSLSRKEKKKKKKRGQNKNRSSEGIPKDWSGRFLRQKRCLKYHLKMLCYNFRTSPVHLH